MGISAEDERRDREHDHAGRGDREAHDDEPCLGVKCEIKRTLISAKPADSSALNANTHAKAMGSQAQWPL